MQQQNPTKTTNAQTNKQKEHKQQKSQQLGKNLISKIIKQEPMHEGKWLGMKYITFSIGDKEVPNYEAVYRTTTKKSGRKIDGVQVIPIIKYKDPNRLKQIVLIANFRPPVGRFSLQFPSGLLQDENYEQNARRQVLQQTGYLINRFIKIPYPPMHCDPWKSNQSGLFYLGIVDGDDPNSHKQQQLDNQQNIIVHKVELAEDFMMRIHKLAQEHNYALEGKVWSVCIGLAMSQLIKQ